MKKLLVLIMILMLSFVLISCTQNDIPSDKETPIPETNNPTIPETNNPTVPETNNPVVPETENKTPVVEEKEEDLVEITFTKTVSLRYEFVGDEKDKPGFAQGYLHVTPLEGAKKNGYYVVYLADHEKLLTEYDEFASFVITGSETSYYIKDGRYLPYEARRLVIFESKKQFYNENFKIEDASDIIEIPKEKRLKLTDSTFTFGTTSDIHINFESLGFGSRNKWVQTLDFYSSKNVNHLIITGDMTGESGLEDDYQYYIDSIKNSSIPLSNVYEAIGNHGNSSSMLPYFTKYTSGSDEVHPYPNSAYYHVFVGGNLFIFMAQELNGPSDSAAYDNFSKAQIDWLEGLLDTYGKTDTNIFVIIHSPFLNFGPGDRNNGTYTKMITFKPEYTQTMRLKALFEEYKDCVILSGHTHLTYYEDENYSNENDSFARMVHVSSGTQTSSYNGGSTMISDTDGRYNNTPYYGSEGYVVEIYNDYILFKGYNISTGKLIPMGCILMPTKAYGGTYKEPDSAETLPDDTNIYDILNGSGTLEDPYQIATEEQFYRLTKAFETSTSKTMSEMVGYGKYFIQINDLDMSKHDKYQGTFAEGGLRYTFAGNYNGNGHTINVNITSGSGNVSVFPYTYGVITNLKITGSIKGGTCAQPVRALYGQIINCIFDLNLTASQTAGIVYSNYGYVYNVYTSGILTGDPYDALSVNHNANKYYNVYYSNTYNSSAVTSTYGTYSKDLNAVKDVFNNKSNANYTEALNYLNGVEMIEVVVSNNKLNFK